MKKIFSLLFFLPAFVAAQDQFTRRDELPSPDKLVHDITGTDSLDVAARRCGALDIFSRLSAALSPECKISTSDPLYDGAKYGIQRPVYLGLRKLHEGDNDAQTQAINDWDELCSSYADRDPSFRDSLAKKYLSKKLYKEAQPVFARQDSSQKQWEREGDRSARRETNVSKAKTIKNVFLIVILFLLLLPILIIWMLPGVHPGKGENSPANTAFPEELRTISVTKKKYPVYWVCGMVYDKEVWTETSVTTTTTTYSNADGVYRAPRVETSVSSTVYHRYFLRAPDGTEFHRKISDNQFPASKGQIISFLESKEYTLAAFNHGTGQFSRFKFGINKTQRYSGYLLWILSIAGLGLVSYLFYLFTMSITTEEIDHSYFKEWINSGFWIGAFFMTIWVWLVVLMLMWRRFNQFVGQYQPKYKTFFQQQTASVKKHFGM